MFLLLYYCSWDYLIDTYTPHILCDFVLKCVFSWDYHGQFIDPEKHFFFTFMEGHRCFMTLEHQDSWKSLIVILYQPKTQLKSNVNKVNFFSTFEHSI